MERTPEGERVKPGIDPQTGRRYLTGQEIDRVGLHAFQEFCGIMMDDREGLEMIDARRKREEGHETRETR